MVSSDVIVGGKRCDATPGTSGAGILMKEKSGNSDVMVGVLVGKARVVRNGKKVNVAVRLTRKRVSQIRNWVSAA